MSDDDLERVVRAIYRREEASLPSFEESWAAPAGAQALTVIHETSRDSAAGSDTLPRDIPQRSLQQAGRCVVFAGLLAVALLVAMIAAVIFNAIAHRAAGVGPTLVNQLTWRQVRYPDGVTLRPPQAALGRSTYNSNVAYLCVTSTATGALDSQRLWITRDRGATWTRLADVPDVRSVTECGFTVDGLEPDIVVVRLTQTPPNNLTTFISVDGGQRWRPAATDQPDSRLTQMATWQGHTFAVRGSGSSQIGEMRSNLVVSADDLQTWRPIDETLLAALPKIVAPAPGQPKNHWINQFWLQPSAGELLVETDLGTLWSSSDRNGL